MIVTFSVSAQCQFRVNEVDEFTGYQKTISFKKKVWAKGGAFFVESAKIDKTVFFTFTLLGTGAASVSEGNRIIILLDNESKVELKAVKYALADPITLSGITNWTLPIVCEVDEDNLKALATSDIKAIRFYLNDAGKEYQIRKKKSKSHVRTMAGCLGDENK